MKITEILHEGLLDKFRSAFSGQQSQTQTASTKPPEPVYLDDNEVREIINEIVFWIHGNIDMAEKRKLISAASASRIEPWKLRMFSEWLERWATDYELKEKYRKFSKRAILSAYGNRIKKAVYDNWWATK